MTTIQVGPAQKEFMVHRALLCDRSKYFAKALTGSFEESKTGTVKLEDVSTMLFRLVVSWLYTGTIVYGVSDNGPNIQSEFADFKYGGEFDDEEINADDTSTWPKLVLVKLYVLADRLDMKVLRNDSIVALNNALMRSKRTIHVSSLRYVSSHTTARSPLRKLIVDHLAYTAVVDLERKGFWSIVPHDITLDVLMRVGRRVPVKLCNSCYQKGLSENKIVVDDEHPCKNEDDMPFLVDICIYHEHADDAEKKACQASRDKIIKRW